MRSEKLLDTHRSFRCVETSPLVIISKRVLLNWLGSYLLNLNAMAVLVLTKNVYGSRFFMMTMKQQISGRKRLAYQKRKFREEACPIISGPWAFRGRAVLVRKFTSIGVQNMDARVDQSQTRIDI